MRNLDAALGELRELLDMDGYSPAAIAQRAATEIRLAKTGVPSAALREIVVRCGLPGAATGEELVENFAVLRRGVEAAAEQYHMLEEQLEAAEQTNARLVDERRELECIRTKAVRKGAMIASLTSELAHHLGLDTGIVDAWLEERIERGNSKHLADLRAAAQSDANSDLQARVSGPQRKLANEAASNSLLGDELEAQTGCDAGEIYHWMNTPNRGHLVNRRMSELSRALADSQVRAAAAEDALLNERAASSTSTVAPSSTVDITLPGGLRVLIQPLGASS